MRLLVGKGSVVYHPKPESDFLTSCIVHSVCVFNVPGVHSSIITLLKDSNFLERPNRNVKCRFFHISSCVQNIPWCNRVYQNTSFYKLLYKMRLVLRWVPRR